MEGIQGEITRRLEEANGTEELVQLMMAAQIVDSDALYKKALNGLIYSKPKITWEQAQSIGFKATYAILSPENLENNEPSSNVLLYDGHPTTTSRRCTRCSGQVLLSCRVCAWVCE
jgi:hypothetical protein